MSTAPPESAARNTAFSFITQLTTASLTAFLTIFLVRVLGPEQYGEYALALSIGAIGLTVADLGISSASGRFVAERRHRPEELRPLVVDAMKLKVLIAGAVCSVLFLIAPLIGDAYHSPGLGWTLRGMALATFGQSLVLMAASILISIGRASRNFRIVLLESLLEVLITVCLVVLAGGAAAAAFGRAAGYLGGALIALLLVHRLIGRPPIGLLRGPDRTTVRGLTRYASSLLIVDAAFTLTGTLPILLLAGFVGSAATGLYQALAQLVVLLQYPGLSVANGVAPRLVFHADQPPSVREFERGLQVVILFQCLLLAPALMWAQPITSLLLGDQYRGSAEALRALTPYLFLQGFAPLLSISVNYLGEARRRIPIALSTVALMGVSGVVLIPRFGVVGASLATGVSFALYVGAHLTLCRRLLDFSMAPLLRSLASGMGAAGAMAIALGLVGTQDLQPLEWVLGGVTGTAAFAGVLLITREVRRQDMARLAGLIRRMTGPRADHGPPPAD